MTEDNEITEEQRQAVREKYNAGTLEAANGSLMGLAWIAGLGFALALIGILIALNAGDLLTVTIWSGLIGTGVTVGFFSTIAYLATKAIITSRK